MVIVVGEVVVELVVIVGGVMVGVKRDASRKECPSMRERILRETDL
jgi:hypothetical protein